MPIADNLPRDPADLFSRLYDLLPAEVFADGRVERWAADSDLADVAESVHREIADTGRPGDDLLEILRMGGLELIFAALVGLDGAIDALSPYRGSKIGSQLAELSARHATTGQLNDAEPGALLFRCAFPGRPAGVAEKEEFFGLIRVSAETWKRVEFGVIPPEFDLDISAWTPATADIGIGCCPFVESYSELTFERTIRSGLPPRPAYRIAPIDDALRPRIATVLSEFDAHDASIGVIPEATLSAGLLSDWRRQLERTAEDAGSLQWIVVGTGPVTNGETPPNRAVLLHRSGHVLLEQDKMHAFTLSRRQIRDWKLTSRLGGTVRRVEDVARGTKLQIRESNLGRIAVLICEDLERTDVNEVVRQCGVSHVFVPIFSGEVVGSWAQYACERQTYSAGACVVITTSLAVPRAVEPGHAAWCTCGAIAPTPDRDEWTSEFRGGETAAGTEVHVFRMPPGMTRRSSDFVP